jgi:hypothetical protein
VGHFDAKAVYLLSAKSCPEAAKDEAMQLAEGGEYVNDTLAKEIVAKHTPKDTPKGLAAGKERTAQADGEITVKHPLKSTIGGTPQPDGVITAKYAPKDTYSCKRRTAQADGEMAGKHNPKDPTSGAELTAQADGESAAGNSSPATQGTGAATLEVLTTTDADMMVSSADSERQTAEKGLLGLQTVIASLQDLGIYHEYQEMLDHIRIALEGNAGQDGEAGSDAGSKPKASESARPSVTVSRSTEKSPIPSESDPATITHDGKTYEVAVTHGTWFFRRSPEGGWTACSEGFVKLIEERLERP